MKKDSQSKGRFKRLRGVYLLPNLLTTCSLYSGFYSIISTVNGNYYYAGIAIIISAVLVAVCVVLRVNGFGAA